MSSGMRLYRLSRRPSKDRTKSSPLAGPLAKLARLVQQLRDRGDTEPAELRELQRLNHARAAAGRREW